MRRRRGGSLETTPLFTRSDAERLVGVTPSSRESRDALGRIVAATLKGTQVAAAAPGIGTSTETEVARSFTHEPEALPGVEPIPVNTTDHQHGVNMAFETREGRS